MARKAQKSEYQTLYPYRLYYCHFIPEVPINEAEFSDVNDKVAINHGLIICPSCSQCVRGL